MANLEPTRQGQPIRQGPGRQPFGPAHLRASDEDRRRVVDELQRHYVAGRLSQSELDDRVGRALAARTFGDLNAELHDLPPDGAPGTPAADAVPDVEAAEGAGAAWKDGSFRAHATSYLLVMALLVAIWLLTSPGGYFWPVWPMLGWGFGLAAHGLAPRGKAGRRDRRAAERHRMRDRDGR